jgi:BirA family biotin operon repressor/biotin-[acetyl-CoA-carboxylase] ligase
LLQRERINQALSQGVRQFGQGLPWLPLRPRFTLHLLETLPSTNGYLWQLVEQGAESGTVVVAESQSAGRGQWGRQWTSPPGGLYLSLLLEPDWPLAQAAQLTFCSIWGVAIAMNHLDIPVRIKWPNDMVLHGKKLGGMLTETRIEGARISHAILGIGMNWQNPVPETGISLSQHLPQSSGNP